MLACEVEDVECIAFAEVGIAHGAVDEAVGKGGETYVTDGVEPEDGTGIDGVVHLGFAGVVAIGLDCVIDCAAKESIVVEGIGGYLDSCIGIDGGDEYGVGSKATEHPSPKA